MKDKSAVAATVFDQNDDLHLKHLKRKGLQPKTVEAYSRAIRRAADYFHQQIDDLTETDLLDDFTDLRETHSWSSVKLALYGLKFYDEHVLKRPAYAPRLIEAGVDRLEVQQILGHHSILTTVRTTHLTDQTQGQASDRINRLMERDTRVQGAPR